MKARNYMKDLDGSHGNVLSHHTTIKDLKQYYADKMSDNKEVEEFLKNVTSDKDG